MAGFHGGHSSNNRSNTNGGFHGGHTSKSSSNGSSGSSSHSSRDYSSSSSYTSPLSSISSSTNNESDYVEVDPDSRPSFFCFMSIFHTAILFILLFLSYIHVLNILTWPIALYQLIAYVLFTFLIIPTAHLFRGQSRTKFDFEKDKETIDRIKRNLKDNKNGTRFLIILGSIGIVFGFILLMMANKSEPKDSLYLGLLIFFGGIYLFLGIILRLNFLETIAFVKDQNNDGRIDEEDLIIFYDELEKNKEAEEKIVAQKRKAEVFHCPYCGKRIAKKAIECRYCGARIKEEE
ncbi:MAG: zinc ribbon domain-containing protein [Acholeplasmatales bacterium]|nr:zinc ribbon domain-containing protein [Acholeplasmatales bacterium]